MSGVFGALKEVRDEVRAQLEILRVIRRDLARMAGCLDEVLDILRAVSKPKPVGSETASSQPRKKR